MALLFLETGLNDRLIFVMKRASEFGLLGTVGQATALHLRQSQVFSGRHSTCGGLVVSDSDWMIVTYWDA